MAVIAGVANFAVVESMIVPGDAAVTAGNIRGNAAGFRLGALGLVTVAILDVLVAWSLYAVFRPVNPALSLLAAWLRLAYAAVFAFAAAFLFVAARAAGSDPALTMTLTDVFGDAWTVGLVVFGAHLVLLGVLALRSDFVHAVFGVLLLIAGAGYAFDSVAVLIDPDFGFEVALFTFAGEVAFIVWLLVRGIRYRAPRGA